MFLQQLQSFNGLNYGARATAQIPPLDRAVGRVQLQLGGAFTKASLTEILMRAGSQNFFGPISGTDLDKLMKYRGEYDIAASLNLDLCEPSHKSQSDIDLGAIDLTSINDQPVFVEVVNNLGAGVLTLDGRVGFVDRQYDETKPEMAKRRNMLVHKLTRHSLAQAGTRIVWHPTFGGDMVKRLHFVYTGTDWTATTNGNLHTVEVRRKGVPLHDRIDALSNRFFQQTRGKVPQSRWYTVDFIADGNLKGAMRSSAKQDIEIVLEMTAADTITCYSETLGLLDIPR